MGVTEAPIFLYQRISIKQNQQKMKIKEKKNVYMSGMGVSILQGISKKNMARATFFLRDKIYSDKPKASVTEPICNAVDEHRKHNIDRPVEVYLLAKEIVIRDFGKGLSEEDVCNIFFQYFESTKDETNDAIGGFGIGAKAPGAYADQYYVESYFGGVKRTFVSIVQGYEAVVNKVYEGPCDKDNTGIAVRIPAPADDMTHLFIPLLRDLYIMLGIDSEKPVFEVYSGEVETYTDINEDTELKKLEFSASLGGNRITRFADLGTKPIVTKDLVYYPGLAIIYTGPNIFNYPMFGSEEVMLYDGDMLYSVDFDSNTSNLIDILRDTTGKLSRSYYWSSRANVILLFKRGELTPTPSREKIEQSHKLTKFVTNKVKEISDAFAEDIGTVVYNALVNGNLHIADIPSRMSDCVLASVLAQKTKGTELTCVNTIYENYRRMFTKPNDSLWCFEASKDGDHIKVSRAKFLRPTGVRFEEVNSSHMFVVGKRTRSMQDIAAGLLNLGHFKDGCRFICVVCLDDMSEVRKLLFDGLSISDICKDAIMSQLTVVNEEDVSKAVPVKRLPKKKGDTAPVVVKKARELVAVGTVNCVVDVANIEKTLIVPKSGVDDYVTSLTTLALDVVTSEKLNKLGNMSDMACKVTGFKYIASVPAGDMGYWESMGATVYNKELIAKKVKSFIAENKIIYARDRSIYLSMLAICKPSSAVIAMARPMLDAPNCTSSIVNDVYQLDTLLYNFTPDLIVGYSKIIEIFEGMKKDNPMLNFIMGVVAENGRKACYIPPSLRDDIANNVNTYVQKAASFAERFAKSIIKEIVK